MKRLFVLSLIGLLFGFSQNIFAQTCNDPNAHNTGNPLPCETCFDFVQNGDEEGVDCGGSNPNCPECPKVYKLDVEGNAKVSEDVEVDGSIGIKVSDDPIEELEVNGDIALSDGTGRIRFFEGTTEKAFLDYNGFSLTLETNEAGGDVTLDAADDLFFQAGSATRMIVENGGDVGVGTTNPTTRLHVIGDEASLNNGSFRIQTATNTVQNMYFDGNEIDVVADGLFINSNTSQNVVMVRGGGRVSIGTDTSPDFLLEVEGSAGKPGGGSWSSNSDRRLKQDIEDFEDGLEQVLQIRPVWYRYDGRFGLPTEERYVGIIAQEMQEIAPYTVTPQMETDDETGETGEYLTYNGTAVTYMLVNAVQEQEEVIEKHEETIEELKNYNMDLEARLAKIEAMLTSQSTINNSAISNSTATLTDAKLYPNQPNPFSESTLIRYYIPEGSAKAEIRITNLEGKVIKAIPIQPSGEGQLTVNAHSLSAGTYLYSLLVDGELITTEKMILTGKN